MSLLRKETWDRIAAANSPLETWNGPQLTGVEGTCLRVYGCGSVDINLNGEQFQWTMLIVDSLSVEGILGLDFLEANACCINTATRCLHFSERNISIPLYGSSSSSSSSVAPVSVILTETVRIPTRSLLEVMAVPQEPVLGGNWILDRPARGKRPVLTAAALVQPTRQGIPVRLLNAGQDSVTVYKGTCIGQIELTEENLPSDLSSAISATQPAEDQSSEEQQQALWEMVEQQCGSRLTTHQKEQLFQLLLAYADIFATSTTDYGHTRELQHTIHTGDHPPIRQRVRRLPPHKREEVRELLKQMQQRGVIRPSSSPWASPIVLVTKRDGSKRFCVDFRKLNSITRRDAYPLPRIDDTLATMSGSKWFSTLDLISGYWQVEVAPVDQEKTAFCTTEGLFEFTVMPFGLCNAPATFQRLMDLVLCGLQWSECLVYLDDVIVLGRTFEEHLDALQSVFQRLRQAGLKLKPTKCTFFQKRVTYLGHVISEEGIATDPEKT